MICALHTNYSFVFFFASYQHFLLFQSLISNHSFAALRKYDMNDNNNNICVCLQMHLQTIVIAIVGLACARTRSEWRWTESKVNANVFLSLCFGSLGYFSLLTVSNSSCRPRSESKMKFLNADHTIAGSHCCRRRHTHNHNNN